MLALGSINTVTPLASTTSSIGLFLVGKFQRVGQARAAARAHADANADRRLAAPFEQRLARSAAAALMVRGHTLCHASQ